MACCHRWAALDEQGCRLVTRLKKNMPGTIATNGIVPAASGNLVFDEIVHLPGRPAASRTDPFGENGRCIGVKSDTGRTIALSSNDLDSPNRIADLAKTRWQIELVFRWLKHRSAHP